MQKCWLYICSATQKINHKNHIGFNRARLAERERSVAVFFVSVPPLFSSDKAVCFGLNHDN